MDKESLHAARKLRRSFHALARKVLNHSISHQKLEEITERLETFQNEIPAVELPKWWQPETGSGELRSSTYRNRSLYQGPYHLFSPDLDWKEHSGPNGEEGFKFHVTLSDLYEGPPLAVHGGYIAGLFDELLGAVQSLSKTGTGYTAKLEIKYRSLTPIDEELIFAGWILESSGRRITVRGQCTHGEKICSEANALFLKPNGK
jgi:acyl-coenzyme A thioesterase PaaI-like protein|tara:strand:- start:1462 stop:2070 length:609 start_codon:yes stop_codon:yes gene_type:complete